MKLHFAMIHPPSFLTDPNSCPPPILVITTYVDVLLYYTLQKQIPISNQQLTVWPSRHNKQAIAPYSKCLESAQRARQLHD